MYLDTLDTVTIDGFKIDNVGAEGIVFEATTANVTGKNSSYSGRIVDPLTDGIYLWSGSNVTLTDVTVKNAGMYGAQVQYSDLTTNKFKVDGAMDSCLYLNGGAHSFDTASEMASCGTFGVECANAPTIDECPGELDGISGPQDGCTTCN